VFFSVPCFRLWPEFYRRAGGIVGLFFLAVSRLPCWPLSFRVSLSLGPLGEPLVSTAFLPTGLFGNSSAMSIIVLFAVPFMMEIRTVSASLGGVDTESFPPGASWSFPTCQSGSEASEHGRFKNNRELVQG